MNNQILPLLFLFSIFFISFASASYGIGSSNSYGIGSTETGVSNINYSTVNTNNSLYWNGYSWHNMSLPFFNAIGNYVPYTGATTNVDLGANEITAYRGHFNDGVNTAEICQGPDSGYFSDGFNSVSFGGGTYAFQTTGVTNLNGNTNLGGNFIQATGTTVLGNNVHAGRGQLEVYNAGTTYALSVDGDAGFTDNSRLYFGTSSQSSIYYDGTNMILNPKDVGAGKLRILGETTIEGSNFIVNGTTLFVNASNGRVGIGTTAPTAKLDVNGSINVTGDIKPTNASFNLGSSTLRWFKGWFSEVDVSGNADVAGNITVLGELKGTRESFWFINSAIAGRGSSHYPGMGTAVLSATIGIVMPRNGSIVGLSALLYPSLETAQGNIQVEARINNTYVYDITIASAGVGNIVKGYGTQARGTDNFVSGDLLQIYVNYTTFVGTITSETFVLEVAYND